MAKIDRDGGNDGDYNMNLSAPTSNRLESDMAEIGNVDDLEFKWGSKMGAGWVNKEVQLYESFSFDGTEYSLYDCVYMHNDGEPEPYIGKLIGIWETAGKRKEVNVQWFFRPSEILTWLGDQLTRESEIFLATGEGIGLVNVNPLEAIAGKCDVVCISEDSRNCQLSKEEIKVADYIFYRTFDVGLHKISDKIGDKIGGLEVKYVFNTKKKDSVINLRSPPSMRMGVGNDVARNGQNRPLKPNSHHKSVAIKSSVLTTIKGQPQLANFGQKVEMSRVDPAKNEVNKVANKKLKAKERLCYDDLDDKFTKRPRSDNLKKSFGDNVGSCSKILVAQDDNCAKTILASQEKTNYGGKNPTKFDKGKASCYAKESHLDDKFTKKTHLDKPKKSFGDNVRSCAKILVVEGDNCAKTILASREERNYGGKNSPRLDKDKMSSYAKETITRCANSAIIDLASQEKTKFGDRKPLKNDKGVTFAKDSRGSEDGPSNQLKKVEFGDKNPLTKGVTLAKGSQGSEDGPSNQLKKVGLNGACAKDYRGPEDGPSNHLKKDVSFGGACGKDSRGSEDGPSKRLKKIVRFHGPCAKDLTTTNYSGRTYGPTNDLNEWNSPRKENAIANKRKFPASKSTKVSTMDLPNDGGENQRKVVHDANIKDVGFGGPCVKDSRGSEDGPSKRLKKVRFHSSCEKDLTTTNYLGRTYGPTKDLDKWNGPKRENALADIRKFPASKLSKVSTMDLPNDGGENRCKVTHDANIDRRSWWRPDVKLRNAKEIVLLLNLDPEYTSRDVEEIIGDAFHIGCTAVMVQRSRISNPNSGQALVRFESSEATEMVISKLHKGCLMLPNGRPLVGCVSPPLNSKEKSDTYFGHLVIDNIKLQKDAVSTSHCSQPNSIEYEMAMEWRLLEAKFDQCWENLYKLHAKEIRSLKADLKSK